MEIKNKDNRKEIKIRYQFDGNGHVALIDPCSDEMPLSLFIAIMSALEKVQEEYNEKVDNTMKNTDKVIKFNSL